MNQAPHIQHSNECLNVDKHFKNSYPNDKKVQWSVWRELVLASENFRTPVQIIWIISRKYHPIIRLTLSGSALTLFDSYFVVKEPNCPQCMGLYTERLASITKKEEVSEELTTLRIEYFRKEEKEALVKLVYEITKRYPLSFQTDLNEAMEKPFLKKLSAEPNRVCMERVDSKNGIFTIATLTTGLHQ